MSILILFRNFNHDIELLLQFMLEDLKARFPDSGCKENYYAWTNMLHPTFRGNMLDTDKRKYLNKTVENFIKENEAAENPAIAVHNIAVLVKLLA